MSNVLFLWNPPSIRILRSVYGFEKSNQAFEYAKSLLKALESEHFSLQLLNFFPYYYYYYYYYYYSLYAEQMPIMLALCSMLRLQHCAHNVSIDPRQRNLIFQMSLKCLRACQRSFQRASVYESKGQTRKGESYVTFLG